MTESQIAKAYSPVDKDGNVIKKYQMTTADLRALKSRAGTEVKQEQIRTAQRLRDKGMGFSEIARQMSTPEKTVNESTVRSLLEPGRHDKLDILQSTADMLRRQVEEKEFVDVGAHVEKDLPIEGPGSRIGISSDKFKTALSILKEEGYSVHPVHIQQAGTGERTRISSSRQARSNQERRVYQSRQDSIDLRRSPTDHGRNFERRWIQATATHRSPNEWVFAIKRMAELMLMVSSMFDRVWMTSLLEKSRYAQVRIAVGGTHYLKGMAIYKDDLPKGVDLQFNTNKSNTGNKLDAMKPLKERPGNRRSR